MKKYLENTEGKSSKFWQIELNGQYLTINYGKIGSKGRSTHKNLKTEEKAFVAFKKEIIKKKKSGYVDPEQVIPLLTPQATPFNDNIFKHDHEIEIVHYYRQKNLIVTITNTDFYLWSKKGVLLSRYPHSDEIYFWGTFFVRERPKSDQLLIYKKNTYRENIFYLFDCSKNSFELLQLHPFEIPKKGYSGDFEVDENYLYVAYTGGFTLMDYSFQTIKTLSSPQPQENSSGSFVSAVSQRVAFIHYEGGKNGNDRALIMDLDGNKIAEFDTKAHGSRGMQAKFNSTGTLLYVASASQMECWEVEKGILQKEFVNYSSSGSILSFSVSSDDKWSAIRVAGIDLILWNLEDERVSWVKTNQDLNAQIAFTDEHILYQSVGNRLVIINQLDGTIQQEVKGLSAPCSHLHFDETQQRLWALGGKTAICFEMDGSIHTIIEAEQLIGDIIPSKLLVKRRHGIYGGSYSWLDTTTEEETPIFSGDFKNVDFNQERILTTASYFSTTDKNAHLWSHSGKKLKAFKPSKAVEAYFWKEGELLVIDCKKIEFWIIGDKRARLAIKKAHTQEIRKVKVWPQYSTVLTTANNELKIWNDTTNSPIFFDLLDAPIKTILEKQGLEEIVLLDEAGNIYTFHPTTLAFKNIATTKTPITQAALTNTGLLYITTTTMEILQVDLSNLICINAEEAPASTIHDIDFSSLGEVPTEAALLEFMQGIHWKNLKDVNFLQLKTALNSLIQTTGTIGSAHHYFTEQLLASGAHLRHEFAHEEASSSFAMSPDGAYLAIGTWVGDSYDTDGTIQIWEVATGRCVNFLKKNYGGIGWPDYYHMLQWSSCNKYLGAGMDTNCVAKFNPFSNSATPMTTAYITNGCSRPPAWCWQGDKDAFVISCFHDSDIPVGITSNKKINSYEYDASWFAPELEPAIKNKLTTEDLQPYSWCRTTQDGQLIYGYNRHEQVFGIDVAKKQVTWLKNLKTPIVFSPVSELMVYQKNNQIITAAIKTGTPLNQHTYSQQAAGIQFSPSGQLYAVYTQNSLHLYNLKEAIGQLEFKEAILLPYSFTSEIKPVQFSPSEDKIVVLLDHKQAQIWELATLQLLTQFETTASGLYWGDNIVGVGDYHLSFYQEDGSLIRQCHKNLQVEAYNELYDQPRPLETKKKDYGEELEISPYYPLYQKDKKEWIAALATGLVISPSGTIENLEKHLSYSFNNKYAWPYSWGGGRALYNSLYEAKEDPKLGLSNKEKTQIKAPKSKKKKTTINFTKGGTLLDIINVHQNSLSELSGGWAYHTSEHNGIIARKLVTLGAYEQAIKVASNSKEWYMLVANLGFVAVDLANKGAVKFAHLAFDKGIKALESGEEKTRNRLATFVYAPLAAAAQLLGKKVISIKYFQLALQNIEEEANIFEKYTHLASSYLLCGELDKALDVMYNGPIKGDWFSSYQKNFLLLLLQHHLEKALAYFNSSLAVYGNIDQFDLLYTGMDILLEQKNYLEAITWLEKFEGLSTNKAEEALIEQLAKEREVTIATNWILQKLEEVKKYGNSSIKYVFFLSKFNPKKALQQLEKLPSDQKIHYKDEYYKYMGKVMANLALFGEALELLPSIKSTLHKVIYLIGLLQENTPESIPQQLPILDTTINLLHNANLAANDALELYTQLASIALQLGNQTQVAILMETIKKLVKKNKNLNSDTLQSWYINLDLLEESYTLFKKQTPSERKYGMKTYALNIAQKGYLKTAAQLLNTLPAKDLNDRPSAAIEIINAL